MAAVKRPAKAKGKTKPAAKRASGRPAKEPYKAAKTVKATPARRGRQPKAKKKATAASARRGRPMKGALTPSKRRRPVGRGGKSAKWPLQTWISAGSVEGQERGPLANGQSRPAVANELERRGKSIILGHDSTGDIAEQLAAVGRVQ